MSSWSFQAAACPSEGVLEVHQPPCPLPGAQPHSTLHKGTAHITSCVHTSLPVSAHPLLFLHITSCFCTSPSVSVHHFLSLHISTTLSYELLNPLPTPFHSVCTYEIKKRGVLVSYKAITTSLSKSASMQIQCNFLLPSSLLLPPSSFCCPLQLLCHKDQYIQKMALECVLTYKDPAILPYK